MTRTSSCPSAITATYAGLGLTLLATLAPFIDRATTNQIAEHIRAGYPGYTTTEVDAATVTSLVLLGSIGVLGITAWLVTARAIVTAKRWAPIVATAFLVAGVGVGLAELLTRDTSGDTGLPPMYGALALLPCVAGLVVVTTLWRGRDTDQRLAR
jgi:hypothetical protein